VTPETGLSVIQQIEVIEGISALVVLIAGLWLLGARKLIIGAEYEAMKQDRDMWRSMYLALRNNRNRQGGGDG
jgi:hypothetical protein